jgi:hypothetical protein
MHHQTHLYGSWHVRLLVSKPQQSCHTEGNKQRLIECSIVEESVKVWNTGVDARNDALQTKRIRRVTITVANDQ